MGWATFNEGDRVKARDQDLVGTVAWVHPRYPDELSVHWDGEDRSTPDVMSADGLDLFQRAVS